MRRARAPLGLDSGGVGTITCRSGCFHSAASRHPRHFPQAEDFLQPDEPFAGIDVKHFRLHILVDVAAELQLAQGIDVVPQPARFLKLHFAGGCLHLQQHFLDEPFPLAFEYKS